MIGIDGNPVIDRPFPLPGIVGTKGNEQSGDITCIMAYTNMYQWAHKYANGTYYYYAVPPLATGKIFCTGDVGPQGTLNANGAFFENATTGNCKSRMKFKP